MLQHGVRYLIAPAAGSATPLSTTLVETFLTRCTSAEYRSGGFYIASLGQDGGCASRAGPPRFQPRRANMTTGTRASYMNAPGTRPVCGDIPRHADCLQFAGASFRFSFDGMEVTYIYTKAFNRGIAKSASTARARATWICIPLQRSGRPAAASSAASPARTGC